MEDYLYKNDYYKVTINEDKTAYEVTNLRSDVVELECLELPKCVVFINTAAEILTQADSTGSLIQ